MCSPPSLAETTFGFPDASAGETDKQKDEAPKGGEIIADLQQKRGGSGLQQKRKSIVWKDSYKVALTPYNFVANGIKYVPMLNFL